MPAAGWPWPQELWGGCEAVAQCHSQARMAVVFVSLLCVGYMAAKSISS